MQINSIKTSEANKEVIIKLSHRFEHDAENHISRIALSYSLSRGVQLTLAEDLKDSRGKEYKASTLFGKYQLFYVALICQHYQLHQSDQDVSRYLKMHIDHGLELLNNLFEEDKQLNDFDFMVGRIENGIESLKSTNIEHDAITLSEGALQGRELSKNGFRDCINIELGNSIEDSKPVLMHWNDINIHNNAHIAVAGQSGSGKTRFALDFLRQISEKTGGKTNFIFLDFKGLQEADRNKLDPFFKATDAKFVSPPHHPFPVNPISFIDPINQQKRTMGISRLVDIINSYVNLGPAQQSTLRNAIKAAFDEKKVGSYPSFLDIKKQLVEKFEEQPNKLTAVIEQLSELELFSQEMTDDFYDKNYYVSLAPDLSDDIRFTASFLAINYIYQTFMHMEDAPIVNGMQEIRYILLIDEAHNLFRLKKARRLLDKILREVRSKGVSLFMLSQGYEDFINKDMDFVSNCDTRLLLNINNKNDLKGINRFIGSGNNRQKSLQKALGNLGPMKAIHIEDEVPILFNLTSS